MSSSNLPASANLYWVPKAYEEVVHEIEIKRSRFIAYANRIDSPEDAKDILECLRRTHFDARHHCSALAIGPRREVQRNSDDGEPSGTAGVPMMEAIMQRDMPDGSNTLSDVSVIVVRYFGGTLLGAGGLVRAYSEAVSRVLDGTPLAKRVLMQKFVVTTNAADAGRLNFDLRNHGIEVLDTSYGPTSVDIQVGVLHQPQAISKLHETVAHVTSGSAEITMADSDWVDEEGQAV
ncbi:IMPACT family protein [Neomicrococcus lactis]|uniref:Putative YigZ family protein n=1 Tax=Neomicrococcus lactis TaxID=732241 RepID=A0A7W8YAD1_9MICC|nr:YigZ family protein [Neomicrococcus lactis]MBB5597885.1 putative YigZ family protein [Neomicrococcus lactis]